MYRKFARLESVAYDWDDPRIGDFISIVRTFSWFIFIYPIINKYDIIWWKKKSFKLELSYEEH